MLHFHRPGRDEFQFLPHDLFAQDMQCSATFRTDLFFIWQNVLHHFHRQFRRQAVRTALCFLAVMLLHLAKRGLIRLLIGSMLGFVEQIQLAIFTFLTGGAKLAVLRKANLLL